METYQSCMIHIIVPQMSDSDTEGLYQCFSRKATPIEKKMKQS